MKNKIVKKINENLDRAIEISTLFLIIIGITYIYFTTIVKQGTIAGFSQYYIKQFLFAIVGFILMFFVSKVSYHHFKKASIWLILLSIICLVLVLLIGKEINHAKRWLNTGLGFAFQPLELVKLSIIIFFAQALEKKQSYISDYKRTLIPHILLLCIFAVFFAKQPDFDAILIIFIFSYIMMFLAKIPFKQLLISCVIYIPAAFIIFILKPGKINHVIKRIQSFIDPMRYANDGAYQFLRSKSALCESGFFGVGAEKLKSLRIPEIHTDFIITMILEDNGFITCIVILALYFTIIYAGIYTALKSNDYFAKYLAIGIVLMLAIEVYMNIGMVIGCAPIMGLTLPFISYGGSSLLMHMVAMGILLNIITHNKRAD